MEHTSQITKLLAASKGGDRAALDKLMPLVYAELRKIARGRLQRERADHTLEATALVHEAYLRLVDVNRIEWRDRVHFFAMASQMMRQILVDYARRRNAEKREGEKRKLPLDDVLPLAAADAENITALDEALTRLESINPRHCRIVECQCFGGMTMEEIAEALAVSPATVKRDLRFAKSWLARELKK